VSTYARMVPARGVETTLPNPASRNPTNIMSASLMQAARANTELDPGAGKITLKATGGRGTMKAGQYDPVRPLLRPREVQHAHTLHDRNQRRSLSVR